MAISSAPSLSELKAEFGGDSPAYLGNYLEGGPLIGRGVYAPNGIPQADLVSLEDFIGARNAFHYYNSHSTRLQWSAQTGWSIDYYAGALRATVAWWANDPPNFGDVQSPYLQFGNAFGTDGSGRFFHNVHSVILVPNTDVYCTNGNFLRNGAWNANYASGGWTHRLRWDGANSISITINPTWSGTGDTGTSISMGNMRQAFVNTFGSTTFTFNFR